MALAESLALPRLLRRYPQHLKEKRSFLVGVGVPVACRSSGCPFTLDPVFIDKFAVGEDRLHVDPSISKNFWNGAPGVAGENHRLCVARSDVERRFSIVVTWAPDH